MPRQSREELSEARISEAGRATGTRFTDLRIDVHSTEDDARLVTVGGVWDRREKCFDEEQGATLCRRVQVQPAQFEAFAWFLDWLEAYAVGEHIDRVETERVWSVLFSGGRRGGKTHLGVWAEGIAGVAVPGLQSWIVSESINKSTECDVAVRSIWAPSWFYDRGSPWWEYSLVNGSQIWQKSAHDPEALKQGGVGIVMINEGQKIQERAFINCRGATADTGGLTIVAANPPETARGGWVLDFHDEVKAGRRKAKHFHFDSALNPFIVHESLDDLADEVDERTFAIEVKGEFLPRSDIVFYNWNRRENEIPVPDLGDFTAEFLRRHFRKDFQHVLGIDFQLHPYMAAVELRFFHDPEPEETKPLIWFPNAMTVEGNEGDLADVLVMEGYDPEATVLICDASGWWQDAERRKGRASVNLLKQAGFRHCFRPDKKMKANPHIHERVKATLSLVKAKSGKRRCFADPSQLELTRAIRSWETRAGVPYRASKYAHLCDAATYPIWRFFPRRRERARFGMRITKGFSRRDQMKGL